MRSIHLKDAMSARMRLGSALAFLLGMLILASVSTLAFYELLFRGRIYPGVSALGFDLGGLRPEDAERLLPPDIEPYLREPLILSYGDRTWFVTPEELGARFDIQAMVASAYQVGRGRSLRENPSEQLNALRFGHSVGKAVAFDEDVPTFRLGHLVSQVNSPPRDAGLILRGLEVEATPSQVGLEMDIAATWERIRRRIADFSGGEVELVIHEVPPLIPDVNEVKTRLERIIGSPLTLTYTERMGSLLRPSVEHRWTLSRADIANMLTFSQIPSNGRMRLEVGLDRGKLEAWVRQIAPEIERPPKRARFEFDEATGKLRPIVHSHWGIALDVEAAVHLIEARVESRERVVHLPVLPIKPRVATEDADKLGIEELISQEVTSFKGSSEERAHNIRLAASKFHGLVIPPSEVFSFNENLGEVSAEAGYEESPIIWGSRLRREPGGGICQVATTCFRAAFWGGYPIVERHPHAFRILRYEPPMGFDATVYPSSVDLKFLNDTPYHLLIETEMDMATGKLVFRFYSTDIGRTVEMEEPVVENKVPHGPAIYEEDPTLPKGTVKQVEYARDGMDVTLYRIIKMDGETKREKFFVRYEPWRAVYRVGTGEEL